jgi:hypothetical protein
LRHGGSGLTGMLKKSKFTVVMVDILGFVNQSSEIDVTEFLIAIALAFEEGLPADQQTQHEDFSARFRRFLQQKRSRSTRVRGELDAALAAYTESLRWYERLEAVYGEPYADPDELADLRANVEQVRSRIEAGS